MQIHFIGIGTKAFSVISKRKGEREIERLEWLKVHVPCYLYDESVIRAQCQRLNPGRAAFSFLYSVKANPFSNVLRDVFAEGFGADAASVREVALARENGLKPGQIFYSAPGRSKEELVQSYGNCVITADSFGDIRRLDKLAAARGDILDIGVRIAPESDMDGNPAGPTKFGIGAEEAGELEALLARCPNVRVAGIHVHIRSQVLDASALGRYYESCLRLAQRMNELSGVEVQFLNFGSGIGVAYDPSHEQEFDLERLFEFATRVQAENNATLKARLYIETGRSVVCQAGTYYTRVNDIKVSRGKKYLVVLGGLNGFLRPAIADLLCRTAGVNLPGQEPLYTNANEFDIRVLNDASRTERVSVVGNLCTALDVLKEDVELNEAQVGDLVAVTNAGSYACSLSPVLFSSHGKPGEYHLRSDGTLETE